MTRDLDLGRTAGRIAVACAFANALAAAAGYAWIRPGAAGAGPCAVRFEYLSLHGGRWIAAWVAIALASLLVLLFSILLALTLDPGRRRMAWWAVGIGAFGLVMGLTDVMLSLMTPPRLAQVFLRSDIASVDVQWLEIYLLRVDRLSAIVGGFVGGLIGAISGLILNAIAFRTRGFPRWMAWAGLPAWGFATLMAFCSLGGFAAAAAVLAPAARLSLAAWSFAIAAGYHGGPAFQPQQPASTSIPPPPSDPPAP
jgi:hypothetical protein